MVIIVKNLTISNKRATILIYSKRGRIYMGKSQDEVTIALNEMKKRCNPEEYCKTYQADQLFDYMATLDDSIITLASYKLTIEISNFGNCSENPFAPSEPIDARIKRESTCELLDFLIKVYKMNFNNVKSSRKGDSR